jgi:hypothetical protein
VTDPHPRHRLLLLGTAWAETTTLAILLVNIATVHAPAVTSVVGRLHGGLFVVCAAACVLAQRWRGWSWPFVVATLLPAIGPVLAIEKVRREDRARAAADPAPVPAGAGGPAVP